MKTLTTKKAVSLAICVLLIVLFLCGWVKASISSMFSVETESYSMFGLAGLMGQISSVVDQAKSWIDSDELAAAAVMMKLVTALFYLIVLAMIGSVLLNIYDTLFGEGKRAVGSLVVMGITLLIIIIVAIINAALEDQIGYGSLLRLSVSPFLTLLAAGGGLAVLKKMPEGAAIGGLPGSNIVGGLGSKLGKIRDDLADKVQVKPGRDGIGKVSAGTTRYPIYYYSPSSRVRPVSAAIASASRTLGFDFVSYSTGPITAIRASVELVTPFREVIKVDVMSFVRITRTEDRYAARYRTEFVDTGVAPDLLRQIHEVRIYPSEIVINAELYKVGGSDNFVKTGVALDKLDSLRAAQGVDAMENAVVRQDGWICYCGTGNALGQKCRLCGRAIAPAGGTAVAVAKCPSCGARLERDTVFCYNCGARLK